MSFAGTLKKTGIAGLCFLGGIAATVAIGQTNYPPLQVLISSSQTILGQDIAYPPGKPVFTAAIVTLQPGQSTGMHKHNVPLFAMILDGELTVDYGPDGTKVYAKDDALIEAYGTDHNGTNTGDEPVRILAVFAGSEAVKNTESVE